MQGQSEIAGGHRLALARQGARHEHALGPFSSEPVAHALREMSEPLRERAPGRDPDRARLPTRVASHPNLHYSNIPTPPNGVLCPGRGRDDRLRSTIWHGSSTGKPDIDAEAAGHRMKARSKAHSSSPRDGKVTILGFDFDDLTQDGLIERIGKSLRERSRCWIATLNVNLICLAARDGSFRALLRSADVVTADGMPIVWVSRLGEHPLRERVTGADLLKPLALLAARESWRVFLCGGEPGVAERVAESLCALAPGLQVAGIAVPAFPTEASTTDAALNSALLGAIHKLARTSCSWRSALRSRRSGSTITSRPVSSTCPSWSVSAPGSTSWPVARDGPRSGCAVRAWKWLHRMASQPFRLGPRYVLDGLSFARLFVQSMRRAPRVESQSDAGSNSLQSTDTET